MDFGLQNLPDFRICFRLYSGQYALTEADKRARSNDIHADLSLLTAAGVFFLR